MIKNLTIKNRNKIYELRITIWDFFLLYINRKSKIVNLKSQDGFTLIEIGIAIFILGVGLISMLTIFPIGVDSMKKVTQYSNAAVLAESAISDLRSNDIVSIVGTQTGSNTYPDAGNTDQNRQFLDSSGNITHAQYSWQAVTKSVTTDKNLARAQIAIFRNFDSTQFGTGTANFTQTSTTVSSVSAFPSWLTSKHYIRASDNSSDDKFWYRIDSVGTSSSEIILEGNFLGTGGALTFSTTKDIIDIYETMFSKR